MGCSRWLIDLLRLIECDVVGRGLVIGHEDDEICWVEVEYGD